MHTLSEKIVIQRFAFHLLCLPKGIQYVKLNQKYPDVVRKCFELKQPKKTDLSSLVLDLTEAPMSACLLETFQTSSGK